MLPAGAPSGGARRRPVRCPPLNRAALPFPCAAPCRRHFVQTATVGGQQTIVIQMSASAATSLSYESYSVSASAQQTWALGSASLEYSQAASNTKAVASSAAYGKIQSSQA